MSVNLRQMTEQEFAHFYQWSVAQQTREQMEALGISQEEAESRTIREVQEMLPDGPQTAHNYLMTIETDSGENLGFIWTLHEYTDGKKQSFLCDFAIWESKRRHGYGSAALQLAEQKAAQAGCLESVLFVSEDNVAAKALYEKCGYRVLRPQDPGYFMIKQLG